MINNECSLYAGRTLKHSDSGVQLSVSGRQLRATRDCLRDSEWQIYKLNITEAGRRTVRLLSSKTGGDAAQLSAPLEMHGSEEEDLQQHLVGCSNKASLTFCCSLLTVRHLLPAFATHHDSSRAVFCDALMLSGMPPCLSLAKVLDAMLHAEE